MLHISLRSIATAAITAALTAPLGAAPAQAPSSFPQHNTAQVEVTHGRAVLIGSEAGCQTIRQGDRQGTTGRSQLEIPTGSEARISWPGACSVRVYGPSSIEWDNQGSTLGFKFHEIAWADFECRQGQHELFLPSEWNGTFGRSAFHIRGITGGPCEFRLQAGEPVSLQWEGNNRFSLPPLQVLPGSSVRLDRPRFMNAPVATNAPSGSWPGESDQIAWPWTPAQGPGQTAGMSLISDPSGNSATSASVPTGGEPVTTVADPGANCPACCEAETATESNMCQEGLEPFCDESTDEAPTYGQASIVDAPPTVEFEAVDTPTATLTGIDPFSAEFTVIDSNGNQVPLIGVAAPLKAQPTPIPDPGPAPEIAPEPEPEPEPAVFTPSEWRGFTKKDLNHAGSIVAERSSDVEYRILGQGRCKIIVSDSASQPRWCFTPKVDLQMQPGSVAIIEKDGTLRMSFGEVEEFQPPADRPSYDELDD
jgi:hypothetical protein